MFDFIRELKKQTALSAIATILFGLILIFAPSGAIRTVLIVFGWLFIVIGGVLLVGVLTAGQDGTDFSALLFAVAQILFGIWVVRHPSGVVTLTATIVGILVLIHALRDLQYAMDAFRAGAANWWMAGIVGALTLLLSLALLFNPMGFASKLVMFAGICLIVDGVSDLLMVKRME